MNSKILRDKSGPQIPSLTMPVDPNIMIMLDEQSCVLSCYAFAPGAAAPAPAGGAPKATKASKVLFLCCNLMDPSFP
jgi:hypothetical protein